MSHSECCWSMDMGGFYGQHEPRGHVSCPCSLGLGPAVLTCFQVWPWVLTGVHSYVKDTLAPVVPHVGELRTC